jgi:hypothetical protein
MLLMLLPQLLLLSLGWEPYRAAAKRTHQSVAVGQLLSARLDWRNGALLCSCLKDSPECGSWTAAISKAGLQVGNPIMQLLKELTRVWQLDSCYQPGWARGREPYYAAALSNSPECGSWTAAIGQAGLEEGSPIMQLP